MRKEKNMATKDDSMKEVCVTSFPYARLEGRIKVPKGLSKQEEREYVSNHWDEIRFGEPYYDFHNTAFEIDN